MGLPSPADVVEKDNKLGTGCILYGKRLEACVISLGFVVASSLPSTIVCVRVCVRVFCVCGASDLTCTECAYKCGNESSKTLQQMVMLVCVWKRAGDFWSAVVDFSKMNHQGIIFDTQA